MAAVSKVKDRPAKMLLWKLQPMMKDVVRIMKMRHAVGGRGSFFRGWDVQVIGFKGKVGVGIGFGVHLGFYFDMPSATYFFQQLKK
jgi:hypothetical protein